MILIFDDYGDTWVWVTKHNHDLELSPHFDDHIEAKKWLKYICDNIQGATIE